MWNLIATCLLLMYLKTDDAEGAHFKHVKT